MITILSIIYCLLSFGMVVVAIAHPGNRKSKKHYGLIAITVLYALFCTLARFCGMTYAEINILIYVILIPVIIIVNCIAAKAFRERSGKSGTAEVA